MQLELFVLGFLLFDRKAAFVPLVIYFGTSALNFSSFFGFLCLLIYLPFRIWGLLPILTILVKWEQVRYQLTTQDPPGERGFFAWLRDLIELFQLGLYEQFVEINKRYPGKYPVFGYWAGRPAVLVRDAAQNRTLLNDHGLHPQKRAEVMDRMAQLLGHNLLTTGVLGAQRERRRTNPHLSGRILDYYQTETMEKVIRGYVVPQWTKAALAGSSLELWQTMLEMSSRVLFMSFMGLSIDEIPADIALLPGAIFSMIRHMVLSAVMPPLWVPTPTNLRYNKMMKELRDFLEPYIKLQRESSTMFGTIIRAFTDFKVPDYSDFVYYLSNIIGACQLETLKSQISVQKYLEITGFSLEDAYGEKSEKGQNVKPTSYDMATQLASRIEPKIPELHTKIESFLVRGGTLNKTKALEEMSSMLIGGSESTTGGLVAAFYYLMRHPENKAKLKAAFQEKNSDGTEKSLKDQCREGYLWNFLREVLRRNTPALVHNHPIPNDVVLPCSDGKEYKFDSNNIIWMSQYLLQHDPDYWENPSAFNPDRWKKDPVPGAFFPFGIGARQCPGWTYSVREIGLCLKILLENFEFEFEDPSFQIQYSTAVTLRPAIPIWIKISLLR